MPGYHLFIADENSLRYHVEYGFVGTGRPAGEFSIGLWKDIARLHIGDKILFYVQRQKSFYGFFEVASLPFFDESDYLSAADPIIQSSDGEQRVRLNYRALIQPWQVYGRGIGEFELVDILPPKTIDVLWSILYRKLKAKRGCSPIFPNEFEIVRQRLAEANPVGQLPVGPMTFNGVEIVTSPAENVYQGQTAPNVNVKQRILNGGFREDDLHALLISVRPPEICGDDIVWLGNEVYCGAGMQAMDLLTMEGNRFRVIEVKLGVIKPRDFDQVKKYVEWINGRFAPINTRTCARPVLVGAASSVRQRQGRGLACARYNDLNLSLPPLYFEYAVEADQIRFDEYDLLRENLPLVRTFRI